MVPEEWRSSSRVAPAFVNQIGPVLVHAVVHRNRLVLTPSARSVSITPAPPHYEQDLPALHDSSLHDEGCCGRVPKHA